MPGRCSAGTAWQPGADYLAFDASTWGGGHGHLSRLSFVFRSGGRAVVADPGILTYEMSDPTGPYGKSTPAHSTLNVEGGNQSAADGELLRTDFTPEIALIHARYQGGYWKGRYTWSFAEGHGEGVWGEHERILLWVKGAYVVIIDSMTTEAGRTIHNCWQMGPVEKWQHDPAGLLWTAAGHRLQLALAPPETAMQCFEGQAEPLRGWVGVHGDDKQAAPLVEFRYPSARNRPVITAALLAPAGYSVQPKAAAGGAVQQIDVALPDGGTDHLVWTNGLALPVEDRRPMTNDARLAWWRGDGNRRYRLL